MSSARGGGMRVVGRGSSGPPQRGGGTPRGSSPNRGASFRGTGARGTTAPRATSALPSRGNNGTRRARGPSSAPTTNGIRPPQSKQDRAARFGEAGTKGNWTQRYDELTKSRERERRQAIAQGLIADPEKPRSLAEAITPVGTCQDMCAEYERVERVVQNDVWTEEVDPNHSVYSTGKPDPEETRMVKKFRRAAAGLEEQLPSDLRPPAVLKKTCDYLFNELVGNAPKLATVHHFIWDRTRAIRNDFSIQQVTKAEDLRLAVDCYERIARFHIVSLHRLAVTPRPYDKYDAAQEREQLDRTLLSLMQYYDDSRGRVDLANEAEFRAYCVIFQIEDPTPDLEDRVQSWPRHVSMDGRVQKALELYAAACNTMDSQGPLKPRASHLIAQQDWQRFWTLVDSKEVSFLMACVAEVYFLLVRRTTLNALWRSFRQNPNRSPEDWTIDTLCDLFALDSEEQVKTFCEAYGFIFATRGDGQEYLDLGSVKERSLPQPVVGLTKQWRSELVENKRYSRTLPAIIDGLAVKQAQDVGMVFAEAIEEDMEDVVEDDVAAADASNYPFLAEDGDPAGEESDSLFIPEGQIQKPTTAEPPVAEPLTNGFGGAAFMPSTTFGTGGGGFTFGRPSDGTSSAAQPSIGESLFTPKPLGATDAPALNSKSSFNFLSAASTSASTAPVTTASPLIEPPKFNPSSTFSFKAEPSGQSKPEEKPKFSFGVPSGEQQTGFLHAKPASTSIAAASKEKLSFTKPNLEVKPSEENVHTLNKPATALSNGYQPPSFQSAPTSPEEALTFDQPTTASASLTSSSTNTAQPETKASQPHYMPQNPTSGVAIPNIPGAPETLNRKASVGQRHQPSRPSPLHHSFTSEDVSNANATTRKFSEAADNRQVKELYPGLPKASSQTKTPNANKSDFASIVARLAAEITNDEIAGFLNQYVDFTVQQAVTSAQQQVSIERMTVEADQFRKAVLFRRYYKRWKDVFWAGKAARRGNKRRERARRGLEELRRSRGSDTNSVFGTSRATSTMGSVTGDWESQRKTVDVMFQRTARPGVAPTEHQAQSGSQRLTSTHDADASIPVRGGGHKRMKSTSHVDDRGRVTKPASTSNPHADILKRSSFLGFTMPPLPLDRSIAGTKSNYFRLKAMGIESGECARGTKRRREESVNAPLRSSPPALRTSGAGGTPPSSLDMSTLLRSTREHPRLDTSMREMSATPTDDPDEALFARLKAARATLAEGTKYLQAEVTKEEEFRKSLSASQSSNDSPSMVRARVEARWRASQAASSTDAAPVADVPAYRLRESRFVPREQYGKAITRANEMRQSRSKESSRPESRAGEQAVFDFTVPAVQSAQTATSSFASPPFFGETRSQPIKCPNGIASTTLRQPQPPSMVQETHLSFATQPQSLMSFANAARQVSETQDSFRESFATTPTQHMFSIQPRTAGQYDLTVQPSQLQQSLSSSFGISQSQGFGRSSFGDVGQHFPARSHPESFMHAPDASQAFNPLLADDSNRQPGYATQFAQHSAVNHDLDAEDSDELLDHADDEEVQDSYQHTYSEGNVYAALANELGGDTEVDVEDGQSGGGFESQVEGSEGEGQDLNGHGYNQEEGEYDDEDLDGDTEDADEDIEDEELEDDAGMEGGPFSIRQQSFTNGDYSEDEDEGETIDPRMQQWNRTPPPFKNEALQDVGGTAEEAIELSD
ncbi:hypothetical protein LTR08_004431 [Meristemomyces frigidus]|nr:hypothetical protein LTR08_004431 [Meristemomyces frigidus]